MQKQSVSGKVVNPLVEARRLAKKELAFLTNEMQITKRKPATASATDLFDTAYNYVGPEAMDAYRATLKKDRPLTIIDVLKAQEKKIRDGARVFSADWD